MKLAALLSEGSRVALLCTCIALMQSTFRLPGARVSSRQFKVSTKNSVYFLLGFKTLLICTVLFLRKILARRAIALQLFIDSVKRRQKSRLAFLTAFLSVD